MTPESAPYKVSTPYGVLYVAVMPAQMDRFWEDGKNVTALRPRVRVATDPTFEADPDHAEHFTIRRRAYAVHRPFYFQANHHTGDRWHMGDAPHQGGYRNDRRGQVDFRSATYDLIDAAVTDALDTFAAQHPEWTLFSEFLYWDSKENAARSEAANLERQKLNALAEADEHRKRADAAQAAIDGAAWRRYITKEN